MPRPPKPDSFSQINFITNFFLVGCAPNDWAFIEFAQEPAQDLAWLILVPEPFDIGQEIFDPKKGRGRRPGRRGRKRRRTVAIPDAAEIIGQRVRGTINPGNIIKYSPVRYAFPLLNLVEGVAISVAVIEGLTGVFYEGLLGVIKIDRSNCKELDRIARSRDTVGTFGGAGPPIEAVGLPDVDFVRNFGSSDFSVINTDKDYTIAFSATLEATQDDHRYEASVALGTNSTTKRAQSSIVPMANRRAFTFDVAADFKAGEQAVWGIGDRFGFYRIREANILAYSTADFPFPWT